jgi:hypothetical protein
LAYLAKSRSLYRASECPFQFFFRKVLIYLFSRRLFIKSSPNTVILIISPTNPYRVINPELPSLRHFFRDALYYKSNHYSFYFFIPPVYLFYSISRPFLFSSWHANLLLQASSIIHENMARAVSNRGSKAICNQLISTIGGITPGMQRTRATASCK